MSEYTQTVKMDFAQRIRDGQCVICGDKILNAELLYNAHANILTQYCPTSEFANEQWAIK